MASEGPVMFCYDGSERAGAAIAEAGRQLSPGRDAIVVTVWSPAEAMSFVGASITPPVGFDDDVSEQAERVAAEGVELAVSAGFAATPVAQRATAGTWRALVTAADERGASLVVLGSHGRTGLSEALLGSVAAAVTQHTKRPVLVVHA